MSKIKEYIDKAFEENLDKLPKNSVSNVSLQMPVHLDKAVDAIASALEAQALANQENATALGKLAESVSCNKAIGMNFE